MLNTLKFSMVLVCLRPIYFYILFINLVWNVCSSVLFMFRCATSAAVFNLASVPAFGLYSYYFFIKMFQINYQFPITIVCLRHISLNQRILQWTLYILIKILWKIQCSSQLFLSPRWFQKNFLWCVKHLDASIFLVCLRPIFSYFFIRLIFIRCVK